MDAFVIEGGRPLTGTTTVGGAKNSALPIMAAAMLARGTVNLHHVPRLVDVRTLCELLATLGVESQWDRGGDLKLTVVDEQPCVAHYDLVRRMRAGICVLGPLLARRGRACVSLPGGCNIGHRPIDLHLKGLAALGADLRIERGYVIAKAQRLRGANIYLGGASGSTVTGTCNVLSAAVLADGETRIEAAACEPEVVDLGTFLNAMGARISGLGTPFLEIEGVPELHAVEHTIVPDRIEAATLLIAAAATGGSITLEQVRPSDLTVVLELMQQAGAHVSSDAQQGRVEIRGTSRPQPLDCVALPFPGLPTDVQAQFSAWLARGEGTSLITDRVFPDRFMHVSELLRMGADIRREGATAVISGVPRLSGAGVMASDLRASAALIIAALSAEGQSVVRRIYHLDRGYESLETKLTQLGAQVRRVRDIPENLPQDLHPPLESAPHPPLSGPTWTRAAADRQRAAR